MCNLISFCRDISQLCDALQLRHNTVYFQETVTNISSILHIIKRLSYPCGLSDIVPRFGRNPSEICLIFNYLLGYIYNRFNHPLNS